MGVRKYRSVEEMPGQQWGARLDPDNLRRACALMVWTRRLGQLRLEPGLRKYSSADEASRESFPSAGNE